MNPIVTTSNIMFAVGIIGMIFTIWGKVQDPQTALDKKQALDKKDEEAKAGVLAKELELIKEDTNRRFSEMGERMDRALSLAENHTHTVDTKVDVLTKENNEWHLKISNQMTELSTIIKERVPQKIN